MILGPYGGPRGWSEGLRMLGLSDIGIELDPSACATAVAAGHATVRADVPTFPLDHLAGRVQGGIFSPPCQSFSSAGQGEGRKVLDRLIGAVHAGAWDAVDPTRSAGYGHVLEVGRWVETLRPEWVACEQVPPVLPVWQAYAERWRAMGWATWAGILNAADYGVPQTRQRAFLIASRTHHVGPPAPTHARSPHPSLFGPTLRPWVSMADALGWGLPVEPAPVVMTARAGNWILTERQEHGTTRAIGEPAMTITASADNGNFRWVHERPATTIVGDGRAGNWVLNRRQNSRTASGGSEPARLIPVSEPAPTLTGSAGSKGQWVWQWPATTIAGDPRVTARCHHDEGSQGANAKSTDQVQAGDYEGTEPIRLTLAEALILQSFRPDYPVQGTKTKQFEQVGNACPPLLAAHVVAAATGRVLELPAPEALEAAR